MLTVVTRGERCLAGFELRPPGQQKRT